MDEIKKLSIELSGKNEWDNGVSIVNNVEYHINAFLHDKKNIIGSRIIAEVCTECHILIPLNLIMK